MLMWILVGLVAGALAKAIMPGERNEPSGWLLTIVLGMVGSIIGGAVFAFLHISFGGLIGQIIVSTAGALILIAILRQFNR